MKDDDDDSKTESKEGSGGRPLGKGPKKVPRAGEVGKQQDQLRRLVEEEEKAKKDGEEEEGGPEDP